MGNIRLSILYSLALKAIDFRGREDDLMREALSELMAGLKGFDVGGVFLLEEGNLVLRALEGPLEVLMCFADQVDAEELLERTETKMVVEGDRPIFWASAPFRNGDERSGLLVLGRNAEIEPDFLKFMEDAAWHLGKMMEILRLRRSLSEKV